MIDYERAVPCIDADATFYGGPWDRQTKRVELRQTLTVMYEPPAEWVTWPPSRQAHTIDVCYAVYRVQKWANGQGDIEWRYYLEEAP